MILEEKQILERQRLAWIVLLVSFSITVLICISTPFFVSATLQSSTRLLNVLVQANQGTVGIDDQSGGRRAAIVGGAGQLMTPDEHVLTGNTATALINFMLPENEGQVTAAFQIFSNTDIQLLEAETPRFGLSKNGRFIQARLDNGRVRISLPEDEERPMTVQLETPQGNLLIEEPGQYNVVVTNEEVQVTVQEGRANIAAAGQSMLIQAGERAKIPNGSTPLGPLGTERNLILNGDFSRETEQWIINPWIVDQAAQPEGQVRVLNQGGKSRLNIVRQGVGQAEVSLRQSINQDVTELDSLRLLLTFRVINQDLGVCGVKGSECPLFIRINYVDEEDASRTWQQGFYATGEVDASLTPDTCTTCPMIQDLHVPVPLQQDYFYEIEDFRQTLALHGRLPPRFIESILLISSGHTFEIEIGDIALLAED
ncbi:MAG: hypothetical protein GY796_14140 [Chloroflexi bacterium]|nr:hypothetical protein [Chloroflexota bacterium]